MIERPNPGPTPEKTLGWLWGFFYGFMFALLGVGIALLVTFVRG